MKKALKWIAVFIAFSVWSFGIFLYGFSNGTEAGMQCAQIKGNGLCAMFFAGSASKNEFSALSEKNYKHTLCFHSLWEFNDKYEKKESNSIYYIDLPENNPKDIKQ
ncbi:hypothetical protein [Neisseria meningitidis]|uniref:hypothetical protein n=1 Tax=Neisseria meningitidis TaxID=487 RepID=UPI000F5444A7|nr:hypothetical protein [Neisseria meningitidis]RQK00591.1 hypothetical protein COI00_05905 [Neisseria meningitidis]